MLWGYLEAVSQGRDTYSSSIAVLSVVAADADGLALSVGLLASGSAAAVVIGGRAAVWVSRRAVVL